MRQLFGKILIYLLIVPFTFYLAIKLVRPSRRPFVEHPRDHDIPYEEVTFPGEVGPLSAWYLPGTNGITLIALHGIGDNKQQWLVPAIDLQRRGFSLLLLDFRAHGASAGHLCAFGDRETRDVAAALAYLQSRGDCAMDRVGVMGLSLGGITALLAAARNPAIGAVMAEAAFSDLLDNVGIAFSRFTGVPAYPFANLTVFWGQLLTGARLSRIRPVEVVHQIAPRSVFIIGDLHDRLVNEPEASQSLYDRASEPRQLWQIPDTDHVCGYRVAGPEYIERVAAFFRAALTPPASVTREVMREGTHHVADQVG